MVIMKRLTHICCLLLVSFSLLSFIGCTPKKVVYSSAESVINEYLKTYYTVSKDDIDLYRQIKVAGNPTELYKRINEASIRFKPLLMDESYQGLVGTRESFERIKDASKDNYSVAVKNIKLEKFIERKNKESITYDCTVELIQTSIFGNNVKNLKVKKGIIAIKLNDSWIICQTIESGAKTENAQVETVIKDYVALYYAIDKADVALYRKIITGNKDKKIHEHDVYNGTEEFRGILTPTAYKELVATRMGYLRCVEASKDEYYVTVNNVKFEKISENKVNQTKEYLCDIELNQISTVEKKIKRIKYKNRISLIKINDFWQVKYEALLND